MTLYVRKKGEWLAVLVINLYTKYPSCYD